MRKIRGDIYTPHFVEFVLHKRPVNLVFEIHGEKIWDDTCIILFYSQMYNHVMVRVKKEISSRK